MPKFTNNSYFKLEPFIIVSDRGISFDETKLRSALSITNNGIRLGSIPYNIDLEKLLNRLLKQTKVNPVKKNGFSKLTEKVLVSNSIQPISKRMRSNLNNSNYHDLFNQLSSKETNSLNKEYLALFPEEEDKFVKAVVGNEVFNKNIKANKIRKDELFKTASIQSFIREEEPSQDNKEQVALLALNYSFPGASEMVNIAIDVFDNYDRIKEINDNTRQQKKMSKEIIRNALTMQYNDNQITLLEKEKELAEIVSKVTDLKSNQIDQALQKIKEAKEKNKYLFNQYALKYLFYHSEILQRDYFLLDKSIRFWFGKSIEETVVSDPDNYRFIYDPDIRLFTWFQDVKDDKSKSNIDEHYHHWKLQMSVIENARTALFDETSFDYYAPDTYSFEGLKKQGLAVKVEESKEIYEINFRELIGATDSDFASPNLENLRLIDFKIVGIEKGSGRNREQIADNYLSLSTSGNGRVISNTKTEFQNLERINKGASAFTPDTNFNNMIFGQTYQNNLREGWGVDSGSVINGYAADASWFFEIKPDFWKKFKDFEFSFILIRDLNPNYREFLSEAEAILMSHKAVPNSKVYLNNEEVFEFGLESLDDLKELLAKYNLGNVITVDKDLNKTTIITNY